MTIARRSSPLVRVRFARRLAAEEVFQARAHRASSSAAVVGVATVIVARVRPGGPLYAHPALGGGLAVARTVHHQ